MVVREVMEIVLGSSFYIYFATLSEKDVSLPKAHDSGIRNQRFLTFHTGNKG